MKDIGIATRSTTSTCRSSRPRATRFPRARRARTCPRSWSCPAIPSLSGCSSTLSSPRRRAPAIPCSRRTSPRRSSTARPRSGPAEPCRWSRREPLGGRCSVKLCGFDVGLDKPLFLIAGPCVVESRDLQMETAGKLKEICKPLGIPLIFKSSYDKANRSSGKSFRGLGMDKGLEILALVRKEIGVPVLTDVHEEQDVKPVAAAVDVLQTPAFLCRQTAFIRAAASAGLAVNNHYVQI